MFGSFLFVTLGAHKYNFISLIYFLTTRSNNLSTTNKKNRHPTMHMEAYRCARSVVIRYSSLMHPNMDFVFLRPFLENNDSYLNILLV